MKNEEKNQRRKEQTLPMGTIVHCTRLSGTLSQLSTYILALVLINSGYSIIHDLGRERKLFSLFYFQNARQPDLLPGRGQFAVSDSIYWKVAKTSTDKKSYWKEPKTEENVKTFRLPLPPIGKKASQWHKLLFHFNGRHKVRKRYARRTCESCPDHEK